MPSYHLCPVCGCTEFIADVDFHQRWVVGADGRLVRKTSNEDPTQTPPSDSGTWTCCHCGYTTTGAAFRECTKHLTVVPISLPNIRPALSDNDHERTYRAIYIANYLCKMALETLIHQSNLPELKTVAKIFGIDRVKYVLQITKDLNSWTTGRMPDIDPTASDAKRHPINESETDLDRVLHSAFVLNVPPDDFIKLCNAVQRLTTESKTATNP